MKPALWRALLTHTVPELKWCLWSVGCTFLLMREPQGCNHLCPCSAMWAACYRSVNICMLVSSIAKIWCSVLFVLTLSATGCKNAVRCASAVEVPAGSGWSKQGYKLNTNRLFSTSRIFLLEVGYRFPTILSDISSDRCVTSWKPLCYWAWPSLLLSAHKPIIGNISFLWAASVSPGKNNEKIFPSFFSCIENIVCKFKINCSQCLMCFVGSQTCKWCL